LLTVLVCRCYLSLHPPPPPSTLFPYTTLFRSTDDCRDREDRVRLVVETGQAAADHLADAFGDADAISRSRTHPTPGLLDHGARLDRKSTRLNSSHQIISYAVFCLKKKRE